MLAIMKAIMNRQAKTLRMRIVQNLALRSFSCQVRGIGLGAMCYLSVSLLLDLLEAFSVLAANRTYERL